MNKLSEKEKAEYGLLYDANYDIELLSKRIECKDMCHKFNQLKPSEITLSEKTFKEIVKIVGQSPVVTAPFWCDYGKNITIGNNFYSNHNLTILDAADVVIGDNVYIAPNCCISTAGHPIDFEQRNKGLEYAYPIKIENNVWIGANVTILPGVTIGENVVIGAGSVVKSDIPSNVIAVGVPCKVKREITEMDKMKYITRQN